MALMCDALGGDVDDLVQGLGHDTRIGFSFLQTGPGWGGPCLPKDTSALLAMGTDAGVDLTMVRASLAANVIQQRYVVERVRSLVGGSLRGVRVGVLGLTFKAGTDDRRDSPAMAVVGALVDEGAVVVAFDPTVNVDDAAEDLKDIVIAATVTEACQSARVTVVLTEWASFTELDFTQLARVVSDRVIFDARGVVNAHAAREHGFTLERLGRP